LADTSIALNRPHIQPGQWCQLRSVFHVSNADVPRGARLKLRLLIPAQSTILLDQVLLSPTDAIEGWDPEVVHLLRNMRLSVLRFPGGNFVSGYHWQDGIGPIEQRPGKPNPAWPEWEPNHVGTNEWLTLCELVGAEPMICVNAGNGSPEEAANWVRYCNDPMTTEWGQLRAAHGHPTPYHIRLWEVGNELWGNFQVG
jgi:alpha-N-arabinofuranosidase